MNSQLLKRNILIKHPALTIYNSGFGGYRKTMAEGGHSLNLSCSICFEEFKVPKMLPCGHTFCCQCVSKMVESLSFLQCPICRRDISLPESGKVEDFPTNFALMDLIPAEHECLNKEVDPDTESSNHNTPMKVCSECPEDLEACRKVERDPNLTPAGLGIKVFIGNLAESIDSKALYGTFSAFGNILSSEVATDLNGEKHGYGYVHFETGEAAHRAIQKVNGMWLHGRKVYVGKMISQFLPNISTPDYARMYTNVYIKNFGTEMREEELRAICEVFGKILSLKIMTDLAGNSRGFGFVSFMSCNSAMQCVDCLHGKEYKGRQLFAGRAQKWLERSMNLQALHQERNNLFQGVNLYIKNLDDDIDDERLRKEFSRFGYITSAKVMRNGRGLSRGFGFVCFSSQEEATKAATEMHGRIISVKQLYVALAQRKEVRQAQLAAQYMGTNMNNCIPSRLQAQRYPSFNYYKTMSLSQQKPHESQLAQTGKPRWPTAQAHTAGPSGYQTMPPGATRQIKAPAQIRGVTPRHVPVQEAPSAKAQGGVTGISNSTTYMRPNATTKRPSYKFGQGTFRTKEAGGESRLQAQRYPSFNYYKTMSLSQQKPHESQLAQTGKPRWPTAQAHTAGPSGYQTMPPGATRQIKAPAQICGVTPRHVPVQEAPSAKAQGGKELFSCPLL
ncbi:Polyadenylate-binding protein 1 [Holothuria leucospilota]|uniref:Polyadenylate-binding protein 1 n=1 Tax=Holothuria leucospilota TaxID=206669 RepID=A0A9Q1BD22_HOLLE|nr:Polyadenylate-binding protein 1 [Holothuria leucospilota]